MPSSAAASGGPSVKLATPEDFDGDFLFCRIVFRNAPNGDGGGWGVDYPRADINLSFRLSELTTTTGQPRPARTTTTTSSSG